MFQSIADCSYRSAMSSSVKREKWWCVGMWWFGSCRIRVSECHGCFLNPNLLALHCNEIAKDIAPNCSVWERFVRMRGLQTPTSVLGITPMRLRASTTSRRQIFMSPSCSMGGSKSKSNTIKVSLRAVLAIYLSNANTWTANTALLSMCKDILFLFLVQELIFRNQGPWWVHAWMQWIIVK